MSMSDTVCMCMYVSVCSQALRLSKYHQWTAVHRVWNTPCHIDHHPRHRPLHVWVMHPVQCRCHRGRLPSIDCLMSCVLHRWPAVAGQWCTVLLLVKHAGFMRHLKKNMRNYAPFAYLHKTSIWKWIKWQFMRKNMWYAYFWEICE